MHTSTLRRRGAGVLAAGIGSVLLLTGCGFNAQTLQPYTPAEGVNAQVGTVKVRNLVLVSDASGKGYVSASLVSSANDTLVKVSGTPTLLNGSAGVPLTVSGGTPVPLSANKLAGKDTLAITVCGHEDQTMVTAQFDNLGKGASGAAGGPFFLPARARAGGRPRPGDP